MKKQKLEKGRKRYCTLCEKWYPCANDKLAEAHKVSAAHLRKRKKVMGF